MINVNSARKDHFHYLDEAEKILDLADREKRGVTASEKQRVDVALGKADELGRQIRDGERDMRQAGVDVVGFQPAAFLPSGDPGAGSPGRHFRSLGEQLGSIVEAGRPGGKIDERLHQVAAETRAASGMNESQPTEGGFLLESTFSAELLNAGMAQAKIAPRCSNFPLGSNSNSIGLPVIDETSRATGSRFGGLRLYWLAEAGEKTPTKPKLKLLQLKLKKLAGLCYATDELLEDATVLEAFLRKAFASEFAFVIDDCIIRGTGAGQPLGILNSAALVTQAKETGQTQRTIVAENVLKMYSRLLASGADTACWFYNVDAFAQIAGLTITAGTSGQPIFIPAGGLSGKPYNTLLGLPLIPLEQCATLGQPGDLILMDPARYILATKRGLQTASSIHVRFAYDETVFRFVYRVDGQPELSSAITPYQGVNTQSAYIVLAERA